MNIETPLRGLITQIQRFSIHDGPGIRTTVFMKGCVLRCFWCHNPETWRHQPEIQLFPSRCIGCGKCFEVCPEGAHEMVDGQRVFHRERCKACGKCVETCYAEALVMAGEWKTPEEVLAEVLKDQVFYRQSGGGLTLSGGEPLMQLDFTRKILQLAKEAQLHTAIETCGINRWEDFESILPWLDLVMMDIKVMDEKRHTEVTGVSNRNILANVKKFAEFEMPLIIRTPVIPGVNDTVEDIRAIAAYIYGLPNLQAYDLLPYHRLAEDKYRSLGLTYKGQGLETPDKQTMQLLADTARKAGIAHVNVH